MVEKLSVEETYKHVRPFWRAVRRRLKMQGHLLDAQRMSDVQELLPEIAPSPYGGDDYKLGGDPRLSHYELGHMFLTEHIVAALKRDIQLKKSEEKLVRQCIGRVSGGSTSHSREQLKPKAEAAGKLSTLGKRGNQIFLAIAKESWEYLLREHRTPMKFGGDTFGNTISMICGNFQMDYDRWPGEKNYFKEMKERYEKWAQEKE